MKRFKSTAWLLIICILFIHRASAQGIHNFENIDKKIQQQIEKALERYDNLSEDQKVAMQEDFNTIVSRSNGSETIISNNSSLESEVHAAINPTDSNNIVVSPILQNTIGLTCPIYYTKDFGQTWQRSSFNAKKSGVLVSGGGDPNFAFDKNGRCYISWINLFLTLPDRDSFFWGMYWAYSDDGGENWTVPSNNIIGLDADEYTWGSSINLDWYYDKQWMATDQTNGIYGDNLYCAMYVIGTNPASSTIICRRKPADSNAFIQDWVAVSDTSFTSVQYASIDVDNNGFVHVAFYGSKDDEQFSLWHALSKDGGETFSTPEKISDIYKPDYIQGILTSRLYPCPYLAVDKTNGPTSGNLYMTWTASGFTENNDEGADIYFSRSTDTGHTWSTPVIVNTDDRSYYRDQFYSSITVNPTGVVIISYWDARHNQDNSNVWYFMTYSFDGGQTFIPEFYVSQDSTNFQTVGNVSTFGIGEYNQVVASNGHAIPVWADGRNNNGNLDIYAAVVELNKNATGVKELISITNPYKLKIYPSPAANYINIEYLLKDSKQIKTYMVAEDGKVIRHIENSSKKQGKHSQVVNVSDLPKGLYQVILETDENIVARSFLKL